MRPAVDTPEVASAQALRWDGCSNNRGGVGGVTVLVLVVVLVVVLMVVLCVRGRRAICSISRGVLLEQSPQGRLELLGDLLHLGVDKEAEKPMGDGDGCAAVLDVGQDVLLEEAAHLVLEALLAREARQREAHHPLEEVAEYEQRGRRVNVHKVRTALRPPVAAVVRPVIVTVAFVPHAGDAPPISSVSSLGAIHFGWRRIVGLGEARLAVASGAYAGPLGFLRQGCHARVVIQRLSESNLAL
mmetsp:Transcript_67507/g.144405  ORF Transcript_67507/g.144405 Transcript_67507/m.144405 type:complete len:243 (+) Transcript_67507:1316-2044(+)